MTKQSIDLGELQQKLVAARKLHSSNAKALEKTQGQFDRSKADLQHAEQALREASRTVLS